MSDKLKHLIIDFKISSSHIGIPISATRFLGYDGLKIKCSFLWMSNYFKGICN